MASRKINIEELVKELEFSASSSGGPGGQNVNKVATKVTLRFDVSRTSLLSEAEKATIKTKLSTKITTDGVLVLSAQENRSQLQNKQAVIRKAETLLNNALIKKKPRKPTRPTKAAIQNRINAKKQQSEKKEWRKKL